MYMHKKVCQIKMSAAAESNMATVTDAVASPVATTDAIVIIVKPKRATKATKAKKVAATATAAAAVETAATATEAETTPVITTVAVVKPKRTKAKATNAAEAPVVVEEPPICPICIAPFTEVLRRPISCPACSEEICCKCVESYLLNIVDDPHCIHCKVQWNRAFLSTACTKTYLQTAFYRKRQELLYERERSFFPQYQPVAERELRIRSVVKEVQQIEHRKIISRAEATAKYTELRETMERELQLIAKKLFREADSLDAQVNKLWTKVDRIRGGLPEEDADASAGAGAGASPKPKQEIAKFIRRCPVSDCNGFLSSVWKCGLCKNWVCPDCFEVKGIEKSAEHVCKPEMVETAKLIMKDAKPCPECGELIQKGSGCDQMWCINCHTPFSWETGKRVTSGTIHNPHYFQWLQKGGRGIALNPGHIPCGGLPDIPPLQRSLANVSSLKRRTLFEVIRICYHIVDVERQRFTAHFNEPNNQDLGVTFLLKDISEESYKQFLARKETDRLKSSEIRAALDAFMGASIDLFRRFDTEIKYSREDGEALIAGVVLEMEALRNFINDALLSITRSFNCSVPYIAEDWSMDHGKGSDLLKRQRRLAERLIIIRAAEGARRIADTERKQILAQLDALQVETDKHLRAIASAEAKKNKAPAEEHDSFDKHIELLRAAMPAKEAQFLQLQEKILAIQERMQVADMQIREAQVREAR